MAENQFHLQYNGQAVQRQDFDLLGKVSGLADDRVYAELFRMAPYDGSSVAKGILPYGYSGSGDKALVASNGASGSVLVNPFRALVGSRTAAGTEAQENWRDIRSCLSVAEGATSLTTTVSLAANSSGSSRIDLIYATVSVDIDGPTVTRKVKDVSTLAVTAQSVSQYLVTSLAISVVQGTPTGTDDPDNSATYPPAPADTSGVYHIPIAFVRVPNGANSTTTYNREAIAIIAPALHLSDQSGALTIEPANQQYTSARLLGLLSGAPGLCFLPSTASGGKSLLVANTFDTSGPDIFGGFGDGDVVDDRDWRGRVVRWTAMIGVDEFCWHDGAAGNDLPGQSPSSYKAVSWGFGNTIMATGVTHRDIAVIDTAAVGGGGSVRLYVNRTDGKLRIGGTPGIGHLFVWLDFSGVIENAKGGA